MLKLTAQIFVLLFLSVQIKIELKAGVAQW